MIVAIEDVLAGGPVVWRPGLGACGLGSVAAVRTAIVRGEVVFFELGCRVVSTDRLIDGNQVVVR
jgi:hypothetical protein